ncbi:hypothetical protein LC653_19555 [Nostoc sp. CHAB 5784]|uniref:hypothetical protein n=1 Tax=Nostoc mirabile TaxID=2907820 RepID=UPI001E585EC6|nr:hypothetical protein [Nostoc mirabile]MCC5666056.1 hypothetical protein [Nostoc mirabile CHAB5784]
MTNTKLSLFVLFARKKQKGKCTSGDDDKAEGRGVYDCKPQHLTVRKKTVYSLDTLEKLLKFQG